MTIRKAIIPPGQEGTYEQFHFAPAVRVGDTVYVSGVIGHGEDGRVPSEAADEFRAAFEQLASTLEEAGATLSDIVELTTFHVGMAEIGDFIAAKDAVISEPLSRLDSHRMCVARSPSSARRNQGHGGNRVIAALIARVRRL